MSSREVEEVRRITWFWRLLKAWLPQILGVVATIFSIIWASFGTEIWTAGLWAFILTLLFLLGAVCAQIFLQRPTYMRLAKEKAEADRQAKLRGDALQDVMHTLLRMLAEYCGLDDNSDRVSLYYYHERNFVMLDRYSSHPEYTRPGRREYPIDQGAIGQAWDSRSVVMVLPPTSRRWVTCLVNKHGYTEAEANALSMQCQSIGALRIEVSYGSVGVVVFESTDPTRVTQETIEHAESSMVYAALAELVLNAARLTARGHELTAQPRPTARRSGAWKAAR